MTYLKAENQILRSKFPKRIGELISIVTYSTFRKRVRTVEDASDKRLKGRQARSSPRRRVHPRDNHPHQNRDTIWGAPRLFRRCEGWAAEFHGKRSRTCLCRWDSDRNHPDTWSQFLKRHAGTPWQCDFACNLKRTIRGMVELNFLVFIHTPGFQFLAL